MLKVYVDAPPNLSRAMVRVANALKHHAPHSFIHIVAEEDRADLVILHVIGMTGTAEKIALLKSRGQKYGIIQYCLRTTEKPHTQDWLDIWREAEVVWSYYDLEQKMIEDETFIGKRALARFYKSPLGVDPSVFRVWDVPKKFVIMTSGYVAESECVLEAIEAAHNVGKRVFHLGPDDPRYHTHENVHQLLGIPDVTLAQNYSLCTYVAGLRRGEGFELPAAEGLLCGARPVMFDQPHYREWFTGFAEFIPEGSTEEVTRHLTELFSKKPVNPVTQDEIERARVIFDWRVIAEGFWQTVMKEREPRVEVTRPTTEKKPRLLWVGDAGVSTGFARCTHQILETLKQDWDVHVLGVNYFGDPHPYDYPIYSVHTPSRMGDIFGLRRLPELLHTIKPDMVVVQNDPWNIPEYLKRAHKTPIIGFLAVDGKNCRGRELNGLRLAVFWTKFGMEEAARGGYTGYSAVVPLGVDLDTYYPEDKAEARARLPFSEKHQRILRDAFLLLNVNRNQPRKRLDLTISFFAEWIRTRQIPDAYLFLHVAPTGDMGYDIPQLCEYYGIQNRVIIVEPEVGNGVGEDILRTTYNACDVLITTTQGEGWGLPIMEAMACGTPCVVPDWAALGEWPGDAIIKVPCVEIACTINNINAVGGIVDRQGTLAAWDRLYQDRALCGHYGQLGRERVMRPEFRWENIGKQLNEVLMKALWLPDMQHQAEEVAV